MEDENRCHSVNNELDKANGIDYHPGNVLYDTYY